MKKQEFNDLDIYFEGEIYNKKDLLFDDEFILLKDFYTKFAFDFLDKLDGIFAFCIYDKKKNLYFCSRDRFGNIPFFYYIKNETFLFSTSIKEILNKLNYLPNMNKIALSKYIQYFATFGEDTFYQDIYRLEEATYLIFEDKKDLIKKKYYKIKTYKAIKDENTALNDLEEILFNSIEKRLISSPSALLSGGIDSSFISAIYTKLSGKKINTFSIGYNEYKNYCELDFAKITANHIKSNHNEVIINQKDYIDNFFKTLDIFDEPHSDSASVPLNILLNHVNKGNIKTLLSGEGSDEIFLGYDNYAKFLKYYTFEKSLSKEQNNFLDEIISALQNNTKESEYLRRVVKKQNIYNSFGEIYTDIQKRRLFKKVPTFKTENAKQDPVDNMSYIDLRIWVANAVLTKVYSLANFNSLQINTPFLDKTLVDYVFSIESNIKVGDTNKYLLKKIASKYLPQEIINRTKKGFNSPYNEWLQKEFKSNILDTILEVNKSTNFFNDEYVKYIYSLASSNKFKQHLYSLFIFSLWYKKTYL
ncbi:asparagine synthetase B family protein [Aliarcobacter lanthieri]|uniref:asparagine synthetase B family protein n=1 Tax=Aliarcobacter lanthieri TaxID=1355374 RepID=UPI003AAFB3E8